MAFEPQNNLNALSDRIGINAMVNYFNKELGNDINDLVIKDFYDKYLLDAIELGAENYIFQQYAKPYYVPEGHENKKLKRYGSLTEHTTPLPEGIPPKSDKTRVESFTATYNAYGRYMEFTDAVNFKTIDPVIAIYTEKYGKLAVRTKERLARNELLHSPSILVPASAGYKKGSSTFTGAQLDHIMIGDHLEYNDYRVMVARMKRMLVEPQEGNNFHLIGSPEVKFDLITDPLLRAYYGQMNGISAYADGELPVLFNIKFRETMLDDYAYGYELANPGELDSIDANNNPTKILRIYATHVAETTGANDAVTGFVKTTYYINVPSSVTANNTTKVFRTVKEARLSDGSYIPEKVTWELDGANGFISTIAATTKVDKETVTCVYGTNGNADTIVTTRDYGVDLGAANVTTVKGLAFKQIPIHRCILIGKDALIETGIEGHTDFKMYTKPLGSAGVLDPIDQRQSIGMKCDTLGYSLLKPEAVVVCYTIPTGAVDTNDLMYTYGYIDTNDNGKRKGGNISMNTNSHMIPGNGYTQLQVEQGYNSYGKINPVTGNVDTNRYNVPKGQVPYFNGSDEFGPKATPGKDRTEFPGASDADVKATNELVHPDRPDLNN